LIAVNSVNLHALSAATNGGFLAVYAAVILANVKLESETNSWRWLSLLAALMCIIALRITFYSFTADPQTRISAFAIVAIVVLSGLSEKTFRTFCPDSARQLSLQPRPHFCYSPQSPPLDRRLWIWDFVPTVFECSGAQK
jgi:L-asparagine transporter-like permease